MKVECKKVLVGLDGKELKSGDGSLTLGQAVAEALLANGSGGRMKALILAKKFYGDEEVEVDAADASIVKESVKKANVYQNPGFNTLVFGQVEEILSE